MVSDFTGNLFVLLNCHRQIQLFYKKAVKAVVRFEHQLKINKLKKLNWGKINTFFPGFGGETGDGNGLAEN